MTLLELTEALSLIDRDMPVAVMIPQKEAVADDEPGTVYDFTLQYQRNPPCLIIRVEEPSL